MKKFLNGIALALCALAMCVIAGCSYAGSGDTPDSGAPDSNQPPQPGQVAVPVFNPESGDIDYGDTVEITCATEGASIHYTTDGTAPTAESSIYTSPIAIPGDTTIKAIAVKLGMTSSEVASSIYTIKKYTVTFDANGHGTAPDPVTDKHKGEIITLSELTESGYTFDVWTDGENSFGAGTEYTIKSDVILKAKWIGWNDVTTPSFSVTDNAVDYGDTVSLSCGTDGAEIYYTLDGTTPTAGSTKYTASIAITSDVTVKAIAVKSGMNDSAVAEKAYVIKTYTVTFDVSGHGTAPDAITRKHKGEEITLPGALTESGWAFVNWNDGTTDYAAGAAYTVTGDVKIKAVWKEIPNVTNLTATCTASQTVKLTWTNPTDTDFAKVVITYGTDGKVEVLKNATPNNEAVITGLTNGNEYTFTVKAYDNSGNVSSGVEIKSTQIKNNGDLVGNPTNGQTQGALAKETWMATNGNLMITNGSGQKVEITKTSEVVAVPTGTVATINMSSEDATGSLFTASRKVKLSSFVMSQYPVTRALFKAVMGETYFNNLGRTATANGIADENPVTRTNWFDAIVFCNKLSSLCHLEPVYSYDFSTDGSGKMTDPEDWFKDTTNLSETVPTTSSSTNYSNWKDKVVINLKANGYRLPTETEWEFCARGGDPNADDWKFTYSGSNIITEVAWYQNNSNNKGTLNVGGMNKANRLGLYDMSGNVWEFCNDYYNSSVTVDDDKYKDSEDYVVDPLAVSASDSRRERGGSWILNALFCEVGRRSYGNPCNRSNDARCGFRVCRSTN